MTRELTGTIVQMSLMNPGELKAMGLRGKEYCITNFSFEKNMDKLLELILNDCKDGTR